MKLAGSNLTQHQSHQLGNIYYMSSFEAILQHVSSKSYISFPCLLHWMQEMSNPLVWPFITFYPSASGDVCDSPRHGTRWSCEVPADLSGPMVRWEYRWNSFDDFYVHEPCLIWDSSHNPVVVVPLRWFTDHGKFYGEVDWLVPKSDNSAFELCQNQWFHVALEELHLNYPDLLQKHVEYGLPPSGNFWCSICSEY